MSKYLSGKYVLKNQNKYHGDPQNILYRSSWELKVMIFFDTNPNILAWGSEELIIPYISPKDNRTHRYFPDFVVKFKQKDGSVKNAVVEIKPAAQCKPPEKKKKITKRFITETETYIVNQAKWKAATVWCNDNNWTFMVLTEKDLKI